MESVKVFTIYLGFGLICYVMAKNRGRNEILGAAAGLLAGLIAVIYYWIVGDTKELRFKKAEKEERKINKLIKETK
jgi:hypothetical protein